MVSLAVRCRFISVPRLCKAHIFRLLVDPTESFGYAAVSVYTVHKISSQSVGIEQAYALGALKGRGGDDGSRRVV